MKRITLSRIAAILILCLLCAILLPSCSKRKTNGTQKESDTESSTVTETGTADAGTHNSPLPQETQSQEQTNESLPEETDAITQDQPEDTTESETETDAVTPEPVPSLQYYSYGNGTCCVVGIGTYTDQSVIIPAKSPSGDIVTCIEARAFFENESIRTVQIPSTVTSIGDMAFGGCSNLVYIMVDSSNRVYRDIDGVLYSADRTVLISYPAANQAQTLTLSAKITSIADMALYNCTNLQSIVFDGSPADWEKLQIGSMNYTLYSAAVTFTGSGK
ncbi:MAG: hypothetical protein E7649_00865 [Ruminococcaceae bacterium]|nr:hypothetical protein [Oscillospiraceae bacterium]